MFACSCDFFFFVLLICSFILIVRFSLFFIIYSYSLLFSVIFFSDHFGFFIHIPNRCLFVYVYMFLLFHIPCFTVHSSLHCVYNLEHF